MQPYFEKTDDLTTTQMCIYIDENMYSKNRNDELVFKYLYQIVKSIAMHRRAFSSKTDYEEFSLMCASDLYMRIDSKGPKATPIKSILNYIKSMFYIYKTNYVKQNKWLLDNKEVASIASDSDSVLNIISSNKQLNDIDLSICLENITNTVKVNLKLPYKKDSSIYKSIYLSCLLTILNSLTLSNYHKKLLKGKKLNDKLLNIVYNREIASSLVLYHLSDSFKDYILIKTNEMRRIVASDLDFTINSGNSSTAMTKGILFNSLQEI